jgi:hypothetical protein
MQIGCYLGLISRQEVKLIHGWRESGILDAATLACWSVLLVPAEEPAAV